MYVDMQQSAADLTAMRRKLRQGGYGAGSTQVTLKLEDGSDYPLPGTVQFSEVTVNQDTGTVTLRARFPNPQNLLLPGMFVNAVFTQAIDSNAFLVPQQAVQHDFDGSAYVMLVGPGNKAIRRKINATRAMGTNWVVTSGLARGDKVIVQGLNGLKQNAPIVPVPANAPQDPTRAPQGKPGAGGASASGAAKQGA
jgi:membrane fusion protein (multidrug efflux system)